MYSPSVPRFDLKASVKGGEIRKHYFLNRYVIMAPARAKRPDAFASGLSHKTETATSPPIDHDPAIYQIKNPEGDWEVKVIANKYPALSLDSPKAFGKQEIVVETPRHNVEFSELSVSHILKIFQVYRDRIDVLCRIDGVAYVAVFKNDGPDAGATIAHAHSQIVALPMVPPVVESEAIAFEQYRLQRGNCPVCDIVAWEKKQKERVIFEDEHVLAICPYAGTSPYGVWIIPKHHRPNFNELTHTELHSVAGILKHVAGKLDSYGMSFNFFLANSLSQYNHHFVLKAEPRPNTWGGLELSTGVVINPVPPEQAAEWYRAKN